jgi:hypothetical protein
MPDILKPLSRADYRRLQPLLFRRRHAMPPSFSAFDAIYFFQMPLAFSLSRFLSMMSQIRHSAIDDGRFDDYAIFIDDIFR